MNNVLTYRVMRNNAFFVDHDAPRGALRSQPALHPRAAVNEIPGSSSCVAGMGPITARPVGDGWCEAASCLTTPVTIPPCLDVHPQACAPLFKCNVGTKQDCPNPAVDQAYGLGYGHCVDGVAELVAYCSGLAGANVSTSTQANPPGASSTTTSVLQAASESGTQATRGTSGSTGQASTTASPATGKTSAPAGQSTASVATPRSASAAHGASLAAGTRRVVGALLGVAVFVELARP